MITFKQYINETENKVKLNTPLKRDVAFQRIDDLSDGAIEEKHRTAISEFIKLMEKVGYDFDFIERINDDYKPSINVISLRFESNEEHPYEIKIRNERYTVKIDFNIDHSNYNTDDEESKEDSKKIEEIEETIPELQKEFKIIQDLLKRTNNFEITIKE